MGRKPEGPVRRAQLRGVLEVSAAVSIDGVVRTAAVVQPRAVLPVAAEAGAGDPAVGPGYGGIGRTGAGDRAGRGTGAGLPADPQGECAARAECAESGGHGFAGD